MPINISLILCVTVFLCSFVATKFILKFAVFFRIVDDPKVNPFIKKQNMSVPLLGGVGLSIVGIFFTVGVWLCMKYNLFNLHKYFIQNLYYEFHLGWIIVGCLIILVAGILDDKYKLTSTQMLIPVNLAIFVAVFLGGLRIESLSYPFNNLLPFIPFLHYFLAYIWILVCLSATKFLDGHDGLVGSIGIINLLGIATVSMFPNVNQPFIFTVAMIWCSAILGFLPYNLPNAKLYLGEVGSEMIGFMIGVLSILSGAKVATSSTIIGWFILDLVLVFWIRYKSGKNIFIGGREHWHFRLVDDGFGKWQVLIFTIFIVSVTSIMGILLETKYKPLVFVLQTCVIFLVYKKTNSAKK